MSDCENSIKERAVEMLTIYRRAELGIDGNAAFALLGPDLQEGEAEFVALPEHWTTADELRCARKALNALQERLGLDYLPYRFGPSHPYGD